MQEKNPVKVTNSINICLFIKDKTCLHKEHLPQGLTEMEQNV